MAEPASEDANNPFAPPRTEPLASGPRAFFGGNSEREERNGLASRRRRLFAALFDGLVTLPLAGFLQLAKAADEHSLARFGWCLALGAYAAALVVWNAVWLHRFGQSIGKRVFGIKIVRGDRSRASFGRIAWLRIAPWLVLDWAPFLATTLAWGGARALGHISTAVWVADVLFIFGERKRCLHDWLADTIVVDARKLPPCESPR